MNKQRPDSERTSRTSGTTINSWGVTNARTMLAVITLGIMLGIYIYILIPTWSTGEKIIIGICVALLTGMVLFLKSRQRK